MKIIEIDNTLSELTVDSTYISADSTVITADMTEYYMSNKRIVLLPRILPEAGTDIVVNLRSEIKNELFNATNEWGYVNGYMNIVLLSGEYEIGEKFEINITSDGTEIYRGKLLVVKPNEDIQNYKHTTVSSNKKLTF